MRIGPYQLSSNLALAPMAGVTDLPFRQLCRSFGAGLAAGEMLTSDTRLWDSKKSRSRLSHAEEPEPRIVQIVGGDAAMMAEAARVNVELGAQIIDINMGCPAKKVCNKAAGSALLRDTALVTDILTAVVSAVPVPVTLKIRTGWDPQQRNGVHIARLAQDCGIAALAVHGRTRACMFEGAAEYDTIRAIKNAVQIPVLANGDIDSPQKARQVLEHTGADGLMIGRAAQGRPWIFRDIAAFLDSGTLLPPPAMAEVRVIMLRPFAQAAYVSRGRNRSADCAQAYWLVRRRSSSGADLPASSDACSYCRGAAGSRRTIFRCADCRSLKLSQAPSLPDHGSSAADAIGIRAWRRRKKPEPANWRGNAARTLAKTSSRSHGNSHLNGHSHAAGVPLRTQTAEALEDLFHQSQRRSSRPSVRAGIARSGRTTVPRRARLCRRQPEPCRRSARHQSRHAAQETARTRPDRVGLSAGCPPVRRPPTIFIFAMSHPREHHHSTRADQCFQ
ncbi:MAG: tRNA dihydrouridine synthase DusB [Paludibacter sp.]